jgi:hypothetical protein
VVVEYGVTVPEGHLPVYSVGSAAEARWLLTLACGTNASGEFIAAELAREQTLPNLVAFSDRLASVHDQYVKGTARCDCGESR